MQKFSKGIKLKSQEQVLFFDNSVSTPFPKFNKITNRTLILVHQWLVKNAYDVSINNCDYLVSLSLESDLNSNKIPQATKDLAEIYLSTGLTDV